jgi:hypothetical protein
MSGTSQKAPAGRGGREQALVPPSLATSSFGDGSFSSGIPRAGAPVRARHARGGATTAASSRKQGPPSPLVSAVSRPPSRQQPALEGRPLGAMAMSTNDRAGYELSSAHAARVAARGGGEASRAVLSSEGSLGHVEQTLVLALGTGKLVARGPRRTVVQEGDALTPIASFSSTAQRTLNHSTREPGRPEPVLRPTSAGEGSPSLVRLALAPHFSVLRTDGTNTLSVAHRRLLEAAEARAAERLGVATDRVLVSQYPRSGGFSLGGGVTAARAITEQVVEALENAARDGPEALNRALRNEARRLGSSSALGRMLLQCSIIEADMFGPAPMMLYNLRAALRGHAMLWVDRDVAIDVDTRGWAESEVRAVTAQSQASLGSVDSGLALGGWEGSRPSTSVVEEVGKSLDTLAREALEDEDLILEFIGAVQFLPVKKAARAAGVEVPRPMQFSVQSQAARVVCLPFVMWYLGPTPEARNVRREFLAHAEAAALADPEVADTFWESSDVSTKALLAADALCDEDVRREAEAAGIALPTMEEASDLAENEGSLSARGMMVTLEAFMKFLDTNKNVRRGFIARAMEEEASEGVEVDESPRPSTNTSPSVSPPPPAVRPTSPIQMVEVDDDDAFDKLSTTSSGGKSDRHPLLARGDSEPLLTAESLESVPSQGNRTDIQPLPPLPFMKGLSPPVSSRRTDQSGGRFKRSASSVGAMQMQTAAALSGRQSQSRSKETTKLSQRLRGRVKAASKTRALRKFIKENPAGGRLEYLRKKRHDAATMVMLRFMIKLRRWKIERAKAGTGALAAHYEGVKWGRLESVAQLVEASASCLDRRIRRAALQSGVVVPGPEDARWMLRVGGLRCGDVCGKADIGGDAPLPKGAGLAAGAFPNRSKSHEACLRRLEGFLTWYSDSEGQGSSARAAFLSRELFAAAADAIVRKTADAAVDRMTENDGPSKRRAPKSGGSVDERLYRMGYDTTQPLPLRGSANVLARLLGDLQGWERRWEDPLLRVASGLLSVEDAASQMKDYMSERAGREISMEEAEREARLAWRRWTAFRRWYQSDGARPVRLAFLRRRAAQALRWTAAWKDAHSFAIEVADPEALEEAEMSDDQDDESHRRSSLSEDPLGPRSSIVFLPDDARRAIVEPGSVTNDDALRRAGGLIQAEARDVEMKAFETGGQPPTDTLPAAPTPARSGRQSKRGRPKSQPKPVEFGEENPTIIPDNDQPVDDSVVRVLVSPAEETAIALGHEWATPTGLTPRTASASLSARLSALSVPAASLSAPPDDVRVSDDVRRSVHQSHVDLFAVDEATTQSMERARGVASEERVKMRAEERRKRQARRQAAGSNRRETRVSVVATDDATGVLDESNQQEEGGRSSQATTQEDQHKQPKRTGSRKGEKKVRPRSRRGSMIEDDGQEEGGFNFEEESVGLLPAQMAQQVPPLDVGRDTGARDLTDERSAASKRDADEVRARTKQDWEDKQARKAAGEALLDPDELARRRAEEARLREEMERRAREDAERAADPDGLTAAERALLEEEERRKRDEAERLAKLAELARLEKERALQRERDRWMKVFSKLALVAAARGAERLATVMRDIEQRQREMRGMEQEDRHSMDRELLDRAAMLRWRELEMQAFQPFQPAYSDGDWPVLPPRMSPQTIRASHLRPHTAARDAIHLDEMVRVFAITDAAAEAAGVPSPSRAATAFSMAVGPVLHSATARQKNAHPTEFFDSSSQDSQRPPFAGVPSYHIAGFTTRERAVLGLTKRLPRSTPVSPRIPTAAKCLPPAPLTASSPPAHLFTSSPHLDLQPPLSPLRTAPSFSDASLPPSPQQEQAQVPPSRSLSPVQVRQAPLPFEHPPPSPLASLPHLRVHRRRHTLETPASTDTLIHSTNTLHPPSAGRSRPPTQSDSLAHKEGGASHGIATLSAVRKTVTPSTGERSLALEPRVSRAGSGASARRLEVIKPPNASILLIRPTRKQETWADQAAQQLQYESKITDTDDGILSAALDLACSIGVEQTHVPVVRRERRVAPSEVVPQPKKLAILGRKPR